MKRREWTVPLGQFGGAFDEQARLQRTREYWGIVAPPGLWGTTGPRHIAATLESAEADYHEYKALLQHIKKELKQPCPIRKDRHVKRNLASGELVLRWEACRDLGPYVPTPEGREWCEHAAALLEAAMKDDSFILLSGAKKTTATELRSARRSKDIEPGPRKLEEPRQARADEWSTQEDATLVKWLGPRSDGSRAPLEPAWIEAMLKNLPGRSIRAARNREARLNKMLLHGLASGDAARVPSCFAMARMALQRGGETTATLYRRYALGANVRVRGATKRRSKTERRPSPLREELAALRKELASLREEVDWLRGKVEESDAL